MNDYQFQKIVRTMEQRYGTIRKGEEEPYTMMMLSMEGNLLKVHRKHPASNSRRLEEALLLTLHIIENHITPESSSASQYENEDNCRLKEALLSSFDPFTNEELKEVIQNDDMLNIEDLKELTEFYRAPVRCILRIKESVDYWMRRRGSNGYFDFIEEWIGDKIPFDNKMNYTVLIQGEPDSGKKMVRPPV